jgi:GTP-binding protein Era
LQKVRKPVFLAINKIDLIPQANLLSIMERYSQKRRFEQIIPISAVLGDGVDIFVRELLKILPEGPRLFPEDMVTDLPERFLAAELIREKVFHLTREEIPYATAVAIEEFKEREEKNLVVIRATIQVERETQKGILIGRKVEEAEGDRPAGGGDGGPAGVRVFLELWVKAKRTGDDPRALRRLAFQ